MKTLIILFLIISCGKNVEHTPVHDHFEGSLPSRISFEGDHHQVSFKIQNEIDHLYFESTSELVRYHLYDLGHVLPETIYQFKRNYPDHFDLYLHDQGRNKLLDPSNIKFDFDLLERMQSNRSYLFLAANQKSKGTLIHIARDNKIEITTNTLKEFLELNKSKVTPLSVQTLIEEKGDNIDRWWIKSDGNQHKLIYSNSNELKDKFLSLYQYKKYSLKRINGKSQNLKTSDFSFIKISGTRILQKAIYEEFKEEYYTSIGELPFTCKFTKANTEVTQTQKLSRNEVSQLIKHNRDLRLVTPGSWNSVALSTLDLSVVSLDKGHFEIGLISRKCPSSRGHPIKKTRVNAERELELIVESYKRK